MFQSLQRRFHSYRLAPSLLLAVLLTAGAGLPGFVPLSQSQYHSGPTSEQTIRLMAMTELVAGQHGHYITRADINNEPVDVLVDTGASVVALSWEDAEYIGLKPRSLKFNVKVSTANGIAKAAKVMLEEVEIDSVRVYDVEGLVLQKGAMRGTLLGMSFLGRLQSFRVENGRLFLKN
jgi:aspartyl protease family protein